MTGKYYYLGKNGLEYANMEDAKNHGGGCVGQRFHNPVKQWEPVYEDVSAVSASTVVPGDELTSVTSETKEPLVDTPQNITEYDAMDLPALKKILADKGYQIKGNLKRETIIEKLKSLKPL